VKAVYYRYDATFVDKYVQHVLLDNHAMSVAVSGEIVTIKREGGENVAAVKLAERDYVRFGPDNA
jgi:hypothetical protein